jgi:hypothetical protein
MRATHDATGRARRSPDRPASNEEAPLTHRLLALQSEVGNAAVTRLLNPQRPPVPVQRVRIELPDAPAIETKDLSQAELRALKTTYEDDAVVRGRLDQAIQKGNFRRPGQPGKTTLGQAAEGESKTETGRAEIKRRRTTESTEQQDAPAPTTTTTAPEKLVPEKPEKEEEETPASHLEEKQLEEKETPLASATGYAGRVFLVGEKHDPSRSARQAQRAAELGWGFGTELTGVTVADPELAAHVTSGTTEHKGGKLGVPVESVLVRRLGDALTVIGLLREDVWGSGEHGSPKKPVTSADHNLANLAATMAEVLAIKGLDLSGLGDPDAFAKRTEAYRNGQTAWQEATVSLQQARQLIEYCARSIAVLKELALREYASVGLADDPATRKAMTGIDSELAKPTYSGALTTVGKARSVMTAGLLNRYAQKPPDQPQLVKIGVQHIRDIKESGMQLPAAITMYADWAAFVRKVPDFKKT